MAASTLVEERLRSLSRSVGRQLDLNDLVLRPTRPASRQHLFEEACELYWNELNWEQITDEELTDDGELTEMVFPGLLAFLNALLPRGRNGEPDRDREHRDVAQDFLLWLAGHLIELRTERSPDDDDSDRARIRREIQITDDLIDLTAFRLYGLSGEEIESFGR